MTETNEPETTADGSGASRCYSDDRSVLVRLKASPAGLRRIATLLDEVGEGQSVRLNWYTSQIEFVYCCDSSQTAIG